MKRIYVALENLRSLHNIGAILRTCSFFGTRNVILVGYSGKTYDLKGKNVLNPNILKTSLGSEKDLNIIFLDDSKSLVGFAKKEKLKIISIEQNEKSIPLKNWKPEGDVILVFGNEVDGVSKEILEASDKVLEISRYGKHNSLNVTTAVGIVLYELS